MAWQEELRKLDEDLASGNLSADEYRARRDQILSSAVASGGQQDQPQSSGQAESTQIISPVNQQSQQPQQPQQPQGPSAEATQFVRNDPGAERTQVVQGWQAHQSPASSPPHGFQQPQASPPHGFQQPPQAQQPWNAPHEDVSPPWGGSDLPPISSSSVSEWPQQGPESFTAEPPSGKGKKVLLTVLAVVLVAGIGVAVWALFIRNGSEDQLPPVTQPTSEPTQQAPTQQPLPEPPAAKPEPADNASALVDPPGSIRAGGGTFQMDRLADSKLLPEPVVRALEEGGMTEGLLKPTSQDGTTIGLFALQVRDESAARAVAREYATVQQQGGIPANRDLSMQGVPVFSNAASASTSVFRAVYVLYDRVIIVECYGPDRPTVQQTFVGLLSNQVEYAPPSVRTS
ncbi:hypothetical protein SAMN05421810_103746 [Amycolatopsis arida]|uniref:Flagellar basal body-associated protein FliL n=1 Tax=Amycolatopsis arida TaxID=587909 RepID=A0A1I5U092_9PSEU|nr:SHOCT domain-containing protein [Amycolatopsis arida]TDX95879.1 hypothetical protein CLV69_10311 [Amycolatopsis arida]SFP88703.1 hypothetical protein SAMN05421810_103746 [Amycolatopsis arida]